MIFITTGTQAPFNRLINAMDEIAGTLPEEEVIAQASGVNFEVKNLKVVEFLPPRNYKEIFNEAGVIISHAGMGTIISALVEKKQIIIVPRIASLGEHRNDHQMATAKKVEELKLMPVVYNINELKNTVSNMLRVTEDNDSPKLSDKASDSLISSLQEFFVEQKRK